MVACGSSDGTFSILHTSDGSRWGSEQVSAGEGNGGVNSISWAPALPTEASLRAPPAASSASSASSSSSAASSAQSSSSASASLDPAVAAAVGAGKKRLAVGCCDGTVRVFELNEGLRQWVQAQLVGSHGDWVRGVAWAPAGTALRPRIASCAQDGSASVWAYDPTAARWAQQPLVQCGNSSNSGNNTPPPLWHVTWNETGSALALAAGDGRISVWMESCEPSAEGWRQVNVLDEPPGTEAAAPSAMSALPAF